MDEITLGGIREWTGAEVLGIFSANSAVVSYSVGMLSRTGIPQRQVARGFRGLRAPRKIATVVGPCSAPYSEADPAEAAPCK